MKELEDKYYDAIALLNKQNKSFILRGVLWHQGESDSNSPENEHDYYNNLDAVILKIRTFTEHNNLPFIFATIPKKSQQFSALINRAHFKLAKKNTLILSI